MATQRHAAFRVYLLVAVFLLANPGAMGQSGDEDMLMPFTTEQPSEQSNTTTVVPSETASGSGLPPIEGSGGSGGTDLIICYSSVESTSISVSLFEPIVHTLRMFGCVLNTNADTAVSPRLLYTLKVLPSGEKLLITEENTQQLFIDHFNERFLRLAITVCTYTDPIEACDGRDYYEIGNVTILVTDHQERQFPYGEATSDNSFRNVLDGARSIPIPQTIPFYSTYYKSLHVSSNGLVSFNQPYISWWPVPFPFGRTPTPIIAPFWTDLDFRNNDRETSRVYYNTYTSEGSRRSDELLKLFATRLDSYANEQVNFDPKWITIVTWNEATPYYWRFNPDQSVTFQLVLATDYISTYAFYLYPANGFNAQLPSWRRVVIGHDSKDYINYNNIELTNYTAVNRLLGNTGQVGQWYFNFTLSQSEANSEQLCLEWDRKESLTLDIFERYFSRLPSCPCTRGQAWRDWRFWFAHFWGLSSQQNCATFLWSRGQATIECCYDTDGSLLVGASAGGSYLLYNPLFQFEQHFRQDRLPYQHCCENSDRCSLYYKHRPSDDCSSYNPPRRFFMFGDPHLKSIDGRNFTFNGIGEYLLIESQANSFTIQARLEQFDEDTPGTVTTAVVISEGNSQPVQVSIEDGSFALYVGGDKTDLPAEGSAIVVNSVGVADINNINTGGGVGMSTTADAVFVRQDNGSLVMTTPAGGSISLQVENSFLGVAVELSEGFRNQTRGLLGVFNGLDSDDFTLPNGTILDISTERDIYQFGLEWHIEEQESIFSYGDHNYSTINNGYMSFQPTFFDELNVTQEVKAACGTNQACILDATLTGNVAIGVSTLEDTMENQELEIILENTPPEMTSGDFVLQVTAGESISAMYTVSDPDNDDIINITLKGIDSTGITFTSTLSNSTGTLELTWTDPGYTVPTEEIRIVATDKNGARTSRRISIVLCGCLNTGNCSERINTTLFNFNGHHKLLCTCPLFYGGESCEFDMRGCGFNVCPDYTICENDSSVESGYTCSICSLGYEIIGSGNENKCIDLNECNSTLLNSCSQVCVNTEGNYSCDCVIGYRLNIDGVSCDDIDECFEGLDNCEQVCTNTDGGFNCSCYPGYSGTNTCTAVTCGINNPCDNGSVCTDLGGINFQCVCPVGQMCTGVCNGAFTAVNMSSQTCEVCAGYSYGFNCMEMCSCMNGGTCNAEEGCLCQGGWTGINCSIEVNDHSPVFNQSSLMTISQISWDLSANSLVANVDASDNDINLNAGSVRYALLQFQFQLPSEVSDGFNYFQVNSSTGEIINKEDLNIVYTQNQFTSFALTISVTDQGLTPKSSQTTLSITPLPVPVLLNSATTLSVPENTPISTSVFTFNCSEIGPSSGDLTLSLNSSFPIPFLITQDSKSLAVSHLIDYETLENRAFDLDVMCSNRHGIRDVVTFHIDIENVDDNLFEFDRSTYSIDIPENINSSTVILTVQATDLDTPNAPVTYEIVGNTPFYIDSNRGEIRTISGLDRETIETYNFQVRASVSSINTISMIMTNVSTKLIDINDNRPFFVESDVYINDVFSDSAIGDEVLTVTAIDRDAGRNGEVHYELEDNDYFAINETTGMVYLNTSQLVSYQTIRLLVYAIDGGETPLNSTGTIVVNVRPSPDRVRFDQTHYMFAVMENNARGYLIGSVNAEVVDVFNSTFNESSEHRVEYKLVNQTSQEIFIISRQSGEIFLLRSLDFESAHEYDLIVQASLSSDATIIKKVTVRVMVLNVNDNAPMFGASFYTQVVEESAPVGTSLLMVSALDRDDTNSTNITFSLDGPAESLNLFFIDPLSGLLIASRRLVSIQDYRFNVIASDGELTSEAVLFISVTRSTSVSLSFTKEKYIFNISENVPPGSFVGTVAALTNGSIPSSNFPHLGFRIFSPDMALSNNSNATGSYFHIDQSTGTLSTLSANQFDAESQRIFIFYVEIYNLNSNTTVYDTAAVEVNVADENDNSPIFMPSLYTRVIDTSQPIGSVILTLTAADADSAMVNSGLKYMIASGPLGFSIHPTSGNLMVTNTTLIPGEYTLTVMATDGGMPRMNGSALVFVAILPALPTRLEFNQSTYYFSVKENAFLGTLVGTVSASDIDNNVTSTLDGLVYTTPNVTTCFTLDQINGQLRVSCQLDREMVPQFELLVMASIVSPDGTIRGYSRIVIVILDVNDNAPLFSLDVYAAVINDEHGEGTVLQVSAIDNDSGPNAGIEYSLIESHNSLVNATDFFTIDSSNGNITLSGPSIPIGDYRIIAVATDLGDEIRLSSTAVVLICVTRSQPGQIIFVTTSFSIKENSNLSSNVGTIILSSGIQTIVPSEFQDNLQFRIVSSNIPDLFRIDPITGEISTTGLLDREMAASHVLRIEADFVRFGISEVESVVITVLDQNDVRPTFSPSAYSINIDDNLEIGDVVINIVTIDTDEDDNARATFSLVGPVDPSFPFDVVVTNFNPPYTRGQIMVSNGTLLTPGTYQFQIVANNSPFTVTADVTITVDHALPEEIFFPTQMYAFNFTETAFSGTFVGNVSVVQETPALNGLMYQITSGNMGFFHLDPLTGTLTNTRTIDRETDTTFTLSIQAILHGVSQLDPAQANVTIIVLDVNDNPPSFTNSGSYSVTIFSNDITVTTSLISVFAMDSDEGINAGLAYNITAGNNLGLFRIDNSGAIFATVVPVNASNYLLTVTVEDMGDPVLSSNATVIIMVQNAIPDSINFLQPRGYRFNVNENTAFTVIIGQVGVETIEPDDLQIYLRFSIDSALFRIDNNGNIQTTGNILDHEMTTSHNFTVNAVLDIPVSRYIPKVTLTASVQVTVFVVDLNDNSPVFVNFPFNVQQMEEQPSGQLVATVTARDADSGSNQELQYMLVNSDRFITDRFQLNSTSGELFTTAVLDREEQETYILLVEVRDMGNPARFIMGTINFTLSDINDNIPQLSSGMTYTVHERVPAGSAVITFTAEDPDLGTFGTSGVRFVFFPDITGSSGTQYGILEVLRLNQQTGVVTLQRELDFETETFYTFRIRIRDAWFPTPTNPNRRRDIDIRLNVINEPDNDPVFSQDMYQESHQPMLLRDHTIVTVQATDLDPNDQLTYDIISIEGVGNGDVQPLFAIDSVTGRVYMRDDQTFTPEAQFNVGIRVYDNSQFNLTDDVMLVVTILPEQLQFEQTLYTIDISEGVTVGSELTSLSIRQLSVSSEISYLLDILSPVGQDGLFSLSGNGGPTAVISLATGSGLDRENVDQYTLRITARRAEPDLEETFTTLVINILDTNDERPVFIDRANPVIHVDENIVSQTVVTRINVTDADIGENRVIQYALDSQPPYFPFSLNMNTGVLTVTGDIDYEVVQSFNFTVMATDSAIEESNRLSAVQDYVILVNNINDNIPQFAALAYFGEVSSVAEAGDLVHHIVMDVSDADNVNNQQALTFEIFFLDQSSADARAGYEFAVTETPPYRIHVVSIPEGVTSQLLSLRVRAEDSGGLSSTIPLYISVFVPDNLVPFNLIGVGREEFESCANPRISLCEFEDILGRTVSSEVSANNGVFFSTHSLQEASSEMVNLVVYGWYGPELNAARDRNGALSSSLAPQVDYISYSQNMEAFSSALTDTRFNTFDFRPELVESTDIPPTETPSLFIYIGIGCGVGLAALCIILIIVMVCVFGLRRRDSPRRKRQNRKQSDPYLRRRPRDSRRLKSRSSSFEELALTSRDRASDLAYETMYDDDDILDSNQTMPWFDPKYLATDDQYDGDTEQTQHRGNMRATVDGNARQQRRRSSDESAAQESTAEMESYLDQYQQSTPLQPGQRMGEYDMFARPADPDKPFRPSLDSFQWKEHKPK